MVFIYSPVADQHVCLRREQMGSPLTESILMSPARSKTDYQACYENNIHSYWSSGV